MGKTGVYVISKNIDFRRDGFKRLKILEKDQELHKVFWEYVSMHLITIFFRKIYSETILFMLSSGIVVTYGLIITGINPGCCQNQFLEKLQEAPLKIFLGSILIGIQQIKIQHER